MIKTADLALIMHIQASIICLQIMESNMTRGKDQSKHQYQPQEPVLFCISVECFVQHAAMIS